MPKVSNVYRDARNGSWYFVANLGTDADGKRVRHWGRGYATQRDAKAAYDEYMADYSKTAVKVNSTMAFGQFHRTYWVEDYRARTRESTFAERSQMAAKQFARFENVRLRDIDAPMLKRWQNELASSYSSAYARLVFGHFAMVLDLAVKLGLLRSNPARQVGNVPKARREVDFWTRAEFERVAATFDKSEYRGLFGFTCLWLLYMTGLRIGEAQALRWSAIDFGAGTLSVGCSMYYRNAHDWKLTPPKTKAGKRVIALDSLTLRYLREWHDVQRFNLAGAYSPLGGDGFPVEFVLSWDGNPLTKHTVRHIVARHAEMAGVHRIRVHALRHSHAALLISLGENALAIRDRLGHEDVKTTLGTYGHLYADANKGVAVRLDAAFLEPLDGQPLGNPPSAPDSQQPPANGSNPA